MLNIYNSLTKQKERFIPIKPNQVGIYVCGMTVYDYCHIGHARVMVVFDVVVRYLRSLGFSVTYVRNITDIDDKIIQRANDNGEDFNHLTDRFIQAMHEDADALGVLRPDIEPRATHSMPEIIALIQKLLDKGYAYITDNGDICYTIQRFADYGKLSGKQLDELRVGERVEIDKSKQHPLDFVLWKAAKPDEPNWDSPWGAGRPGWHIECSAMSTSCLGNHFDIHGGGMDLQFPHHENEIAQSEGATGEPYVNLWMHNGFVRINEEKMSKSLGNFFTVREVLERYQPEVVRYFILTSHYRSPLNYSDQELDAAKQALTRLYTALRGLPLDNNAACTDESYNKRFQTAMEEDFNTPEALAILFDLSHKINKIRSDSLSKAAQLGGELRHLGEVLGLLQANPEMFLQGNTQETGQALSTTEIENMIAERQAARKRRDWAAADNIRTDLKEGGITLEDGAQGTTWRKE
ncbi:MAG: cysteine--tRNA ligase [Gammaproteobacteria bacterium]|nr:MAG: cysteine--tRNA ligase [Gammaproteobacteria bacterium]RKZ42088.1 MAG: cysteine--tRNA ligase [Gammaproteobacteria bacterium]RKZ75505.1 MAG: cysteine--tRNA ligase [Gammaproteobacteria bacterium]